MIIGVTISRKGAIILPLMQSVAIAFKEIDNMFFLTLHPAKRLKKIDGKLLFLLSCSTQTNE